MRKQFDIKYRSQIESGEYKVELRDGRPVKIIYWEAKGPAPIIGLFMADDGSETTTEAHSNGRWSDDESYVSNYDLFIVIPEGEMTPFEEKLIQFYDERISMENDNLPEDREGEILADHLHRKAAEILSLAREQFIKDGYVIMKKAFLDAVEKVDPEVMKEVSEDVDMREALRLEYEKGRAEALKDLPRWRTHSGLFSNPRDDMDFKITSLDAPYLEIKKGNDFYYVRCSELLKLPGFKED